MITHVKSNILIAISQLELKKAQSIIIMMLKSGLLIERKQIRKITYK